MSFEGNILGYTLKGKQRFSEDYHNGQLVTVDADNAAASAAVDAAASAAVDAAKAAASAVKATTP